MAMQRAVFSLDGSESTTSKLESGSDPFSTPPWQTSAAGSLAEVSTPILRTSKYYHSRRLRKDENYLPPQFRREPGEKWLWIIPLMGLIAGFIVSGYMIYTAIGGPPLKYCPVLDEDFSSGELNPRIWTKEVEVGGFGNLEFEQTTASDENIFIQNSQLHIRPTLQDEVLITTNNTINLTASGNCTATYNFFLNCVSTTNTTNGTIVQPVKSGRINTKLGASIKYGRVEVKAKIPQGDWLWPAIWMLPVTETYGAWPASGEIDILEARGNNHTYSVGGNDIMYSSLHWGTDPTQDRYLDTHWPKHALHSQWGDQFHTYGLEWSEKYIFTYIENTLMQVYYFNFDKPFWSRSGFAETTANGTKQADPWSSTGRPQTPFDQSFYLILNVAVGGRNGFFKDGVGNKPWLDSSVTAKKDFWEQKDQWFPTWEKSGEMVVDTVKMWQQC